MERSENLFFDKVALASFSFFRAAILTFDEEAPLNNNISPSLKNRMYKCLAKFKKLPKRNKSK